MKKLLYFVPLLLIVAFTAIGSKLFASGSVSPVTLMIVMFAVLGAAFLMRPKGGSAFKGTGTDAIRMQDSYTRDAFSHDPKLQSLYQGAVKDAASNCPKACLNKLRKLEPVCKDDRDTYALSILSAICLRQENRYEEAARAYDRAVVIRPDSDLAHQAGYCWQRLGELEKAIDSYKFALDLDEHNLEARSALATAYVADHDFAAALEQASLALEADGNHASSLATAAICCGVTGDALMQKHYTDRAVENGYDRKKIDETIKALKK